MGRAAEESVAPTGTVSPTLLTKCPEVERGVVPARSQLSLEVLSAPPPLQTTVAAVAVDRHSSTVQARRSTLVDVDKANTAEAGRQFPCLLCRDEPRLFGRPSALRVHMLTHIGERRKW